VNEAASMGILDQNYVKETKMKVQKVDKVISGNGDEDGLKDEN